MGSNTRLIASAMLLAGLAVASVPASAQGSEGYKFLKSVRDGDVNKVIDALGTPGTSIVDTRDPDTGETALHVVVKRRNAQFVRYFLSKKANPNIRADDGSTPLIDAATIGFTEGEQALIDGGAQVDMANGRGETPLIRAVQNRDLASVRLLLAAGANPDQQDHVTGRSARDYAKADTRGGIVVRLLQDAPAKPVKKVSGPQF